MSIKKRRLAALAAALCVLLAACVPGAAQVSQTPIATAQRVQAAQGPAKAIASGKPLPAPSPSPVATPIAEPFTVAWMSDTQYYSRSYPQILLIMTQWLADNRAKENIVYAAMTGDIVHTRKAVEWKNAHDAFAVLDDTLPYGVLAGNHDVGAIKKDYSDYGKLFGEARFKSKPHYGESYENNRGHYDLIDAGGMKLIFVYMGWGVDDAGIEWINAVLKRYPERTAFLLYHEFLSKSGKRSDVGQTLFERTVLPNKNVRFVLCGHNHGAARYQDAIDDDGDGKPERTVYQILSDYQGEQKGGSGYMRLLKFSPAKNSVNFSVYSPYLDKAQCFEGKDNFTLPLS